MTDYEEECFVRFLSNKNRCLQGINRKQATKYIHDMIIRYGIT